jgi:hypothetical protein
MNCQVRSGRTGKCATAASPMAAAFLRSADEKGFVPQGTTGSVQPRNFWDFAYQPASGGLDNVRSSPVGCRSVGAQPKAGGINGCRELGVSAVARRHLSRR